MSPNEKEAIALLREFHSDIKAVIGTKNRLHDWPDLTITYGKVDDFLAKIDKWDKEQKAVKRYAQAASAGYYGDEGVDFDDLKWISISPGGDPGAYVQCWVWVADEDVKQWRRDGGGTRRSRNGSTKKSRGLWEI